MDVSGEWCCVWALHGDPLSRREEITGINIVVEPSGSISGLFSWRNAEYHLMCKLVSGIFLTGTYEDRRGGRSFSGAFQLAMFPGNQTMGGRWIGFDMRNRVLTGRWEWRRPDAKWYAFEQWGNSYFLSYAHEDAVIADHFEALLRRRHCVVLRDESRIRPGGSLSRAVSQEISVSDTVLALHSKAYQKSEWCAAELEHARQLRSSTGVPRRIVLIDLDGTPVLPPFTDLLVVNGADRMARERAVFDIYEPPD